MDYSIYKYYNLTVCQNKLLPKGVALLDEHNYLYSCLLFQYHNCKSWPSWQGLTLMILRQTVHCMGKITVVIISLLSCNMNRIFICKLVTENWVSSTILWDTGLMSRGWAEWLNFGYWRDFDQLLQTAEQTQFSVVI